MKDLVSVIIPSFNRFKYLKNAVNSVLNQTYDNLEIIVINDESSDPEYYKENLDKSVKVLNIKRSEYPDWGGSRQPLRNLGAEISKGKYLAFLDDDDLWMPNKLEVQMTEMLSKDFVFSSTEGFYGEGAYNIQKKYPLYNKEHFYKIIKKKYKRTDYLKKNTYPPIWDYDFLNIHNCVILSSVVIEKKLFERVGGFRGLPIRADYDLWLSVLKITDLLYIDTPLFYYDGLHGVGKNY